jgi:hypothetical protein
MIERNGKPIPSSAGADDERALEERLQRAWAQVDAVRARNADKSAEEILEDVTVEVEAVRQERYERRVAADERRR